MYAIIKWDNDENIFADNNADGTLHTFETLREADAWANRPQYKDKDLRVISIGGVHE